MNLYAEDTSCATKIGLWTHLPYHMAASHWLAGGQHVGGSSLT